MTSSAPFLNMAKNKRRNRSSYNITGAAGEFFVSAELSRRGVIATLTLKNTPLIDVIASNPKTGAVAHIQVKTRSSENKQGWPLNKKVEEQSEIKNHYYVFVHLEEIYSLPDYYIIPHNTFAEYMRKVHHDWLSTPGRGGKKHKDNDIRNFKPDSRDAAFAKKYKGNWERLNIF